MNNFDYATLIRVLEIGITPKDKHVLYVCDDIPAKRRFLKYHYQTENEYVFTRKEVWYSNVLVGKHYNRYELKH